MAYNGYIYVIKSPTIDTVYYGSTKKPLIVRFLEHQYNHSRYVAGKDKKYCSSYKMFENLDAYIELVEEVNCLNRLELESREAYYINNNKCCNKYKPCIIDVGYTPYYSKNRDKIIDQRKERILCDCGVMTRRGDMHRHKQSAKHKYYSERLKTDIPESYPLSQAV